MDKTTHFGYEKVPESEKAGRVAKVFESVAGSYDVMNDIMSAGMHRLWKRFALALSGVREGGRVLDVASGTGDLAKLFSQRVGPLGQVVMTDINGAMLRRGRDRMLDAGIVAPALQCDAERLPFADSVFDCVSIAFGLRNVTHKELALKEMHRVLRPGGRLLVLEFSRVWKPLQAAYDLYSFQVLPRLGQWVAKDAESYRYLAESIRMHPNQEALKAMLEEAGLREVQYFNLSAGVVAVHRGVKI
ncbi:MAG: bifunctional demethylmenaquinone methyltransferase/2-methoxy-6-polyprenyl-1,4-benzoquinol methylase UbiE [Burkholderiales bacterium]